MLQRLYSCLLLGKKILDQFRLERVVGSGGMGVVYEGLDEGLGRRVAVKIKDVDVKAALSRRRIR